MITIKRTTDENIVKLEFPYSDYYVSKVKTVPSRKYNPADHSWAVFKQDVPKLIQAVKLYNITFEDNTLRSEFVRHSTKKDDEIKARLSTVKPFVDYKFKQQPFPHQIEAFNCGIANAKIIIGDEMGLGKTKESLDIACYRKSVGQIKKCLIVCGVNSTKYNWAEEIEKQTNEKSVVFDQKTEKKKLEAIQIWAYNDVFFGIINIEALRPKSLDKKEVSAFISGKAGITSIQASKVTTMLNYISDMVIADEIHKMKNATSKQGIALQQLDTKYKIGLSGTPLTNEIEGLWNILRWVDATFINYWQYRTEYCILGGYNGKEVIGHKNLEELAKSIQETMIRRRKEQVLNLPEKLYRNEYIELSKKTLDLYSSVKHGIVKKLTSSGDIKQIKINSILTSMIRLRQITEGIDGLAGDTVLIDDHPKLDRLLELLEEEIIPNGKKAIIFSCWEHTTAIYKEKLEKYNPAYITGKIDVSERQKEVNRFQTDDSCKIAIGTIGAMGTGLTMTAAEYVIFIDKYWNQTDNLQAEDRAHRIGAKGDVTVISLIAKNTIDEDIEYLLTKKDNLFNLIVNGEATNGAELDDVKSRLLGIDNFSS